MAIAYTWRFDAPEVANESGLTDVIKIVNYTLAANDGSREVTESNRVALAAPDPLKFIAFATLTQSIMASWMDTNVAIGAAINLAAIKARLSAKLALPAPVVVAPAVSKPLPFAAVSS